MRVLDGERVREVCVSDSVTLGQACERLRESRRGVLLLCNGRGELAGVLSDEAARRGVLEGGLEQPALPLAHREPVVGDVSIDGRQAFQLMGGEGPDPLDALPLVDERGVVRGLCLRRGLEPEGRPGISAVVHAGGLGRRLRPLTDRLPKPMLPVGGRPILERTVRQLAQAGFRDVHLTVHYRSETIRDHFGDGSRWGVRLHYLPEDRWLGTAGALTLLEPSRGPLLVINGDLVTDLDFASFVRYHRRNGAEATVALRPYEIQVPYGVVRCRGTAVERIQEKPVLRRSINAGIYLLDPSSVAVLPAGQASGMPDLIQRLIEAGRRVIGFPIWEYWRDVGRPQEYRQACADAERGVIS